MRTMFGTAVAVLGLSMIVLPNCCSTANAGVAVTVSVGASAGWPGEGYVYEDCNDEVMDWDNAIVLNDNLMGVWVLLPGNHWALRCRSMWYNSETFEWTFGPWWYDYSVPYTSYYSDADYNFCPFHTIRFHTYMNAHYPQWHNRYFVFSHDRFQPRVERHIIVNRGRYIRHDEPVINRSNPAERVQRSRPAPTERTTVITRETRQPVRIDDGSRSERVQPSCPATTQRTTTITREREITQPVSNNCGNRTERITTNQGNSRQTEMTRTTTRERSNGHGNSSTMTRTSSRSTTQTHRGR